MVSNVSDTDLFFAYADIVGLKSIFKEFNVRIAHWSTLDPELIFFLFLICRGKWHKYQHWFIYHPLKKVALSSILQMLTNLTSQKNLVHMQWQSGLPAELKWMCVYLEISPCVPQTTLTIHNTDTHFRLSMALCCNRIWWFSRAFHCITNDCAFDKVVERSVCNLVGCMCTHRLPLYSELFSH